MFHRRLKIWLIALLMFQALVFGCSRPIVKPNEPEPPKAPAGPTVGVPRPGGSLLEKDLQAVQAELKTIYFDYDKYSLSDEAQQKLQYNAEVLRKAPEVKLVVEGHCDERGTAEYNLALGARRAKAAADYLISLGVSPDRIKTVSYGSELPVATGHNEAAWSQNRRAYFRVSK